MNQDDDDDSVFERALRADLPTLSEQNRLRQRILAAGFAAGTALGTTNVAAAATKASFGASALSKLSALSWPAKLGVAAVLVAPVGALPLVYAPVRGAAMVSQVRSSAASVRAGAVAKAALSRANSRPLEAQGAPDTQTAAIAQATPIPQPERAPEPTQANVAARASMPTASNPVTAPSPSPNPASNVGESGPAVAAFDSLSHGASVSEADRLRNESTLAAETQLLDRAFAALAAGDRGTASLLVAEHTRRFPNGLLRQERERARRRLAQNPKGE